MMHELRDYQAMPGHLPDLLARFQNITLPLWQQHGIRPVGFWTVTVGDNSNRLLYMLEWETMAERERIWSGFMADPGWLVPRSESERNGPLIRRIVNAFLQPTTFSPLQ